MFVPFGEWAPDSPALIGAARTATNCIAEKDFYKPFPTFGAVTTALTTRCFGAISFTDRAGTTFTFAGDATKLYSLSGITFSNVSQAGNYSTLTDGNWKFARYGVYVFATNYINNVQYFNLGSSSLFADAPGTPPRAKHIFVINNFVVLANLVDATFGTASNSLRWCAIDDPASAASWTASATTQSDGQLLEDGDGGAIQGVVGSSTYAIIVQERAIIRMQYVGSPAVFSFEVVERLRGVSISGSVAGIGKDVFYMGEDGFQYFNGFQSISIGKNKASKYFWDNFDNNYKDRVCSAIDPFRSLYLLAFPVSGATNGNPNRIIAYNYVSGRFTLIETTVEYLFQALTQGMTLEDLDSISSSLDDLAFSLDSLTWTGGKMLPAAFNSDHKAGYFNGVDMTAVIETTEFEGAKNRMTEIHQITPMIEGDSSTAVTVRMGSRNNRTDSVTYSSSLSDDTFGRVMTRANARYHQVETTIASGFTKATGIEIDDEHIKIGAYR